jgi:alpha-glucoside transport system permease protein
MLGPAVLLVSIGLIIPLIQTIVFSFKDANSVKYVGFSNFSYIFRHEQTALYNTLLWMLIVPVLTTLLGLFLAVLLDRMKHESIPKSILFMPMAISLVGASIIWKFIYAYAPANQPQIGLLSNIVRAFGGTPPDWILNNPLNNFLLMIIFVWVQTGFCMVILSAAIKAVPSEIMEASALDGAHGLKQFRQVTFPMIRPTFIVVFVTMLVTTLKLFDIVRTVTGGNFGTTVIANEMYNLIFVQFNNGQGSALTVLLFLIVLPFMIYNFINLRRAQRG